VARLVRTFLLLSLATVGLLGGIAFVQARNALTASVLDRLEVAVTLKEEALSQWVDDQTRDFLLLSELPSLRNAATTVLAADRSSDRWRQARESLSDALHVALDRNPEWQEILLLSERSEILLSTEPSHVGDHRILDRFFVEGQRGTYLQKVYPSPITFRPTVTVATPIPGGSEAGPGVLALHLDLERIDRILLERAGPGAVSESYLVDPFNVLISGQRFGRDEHPRGVHSPGIDRALDRRSGSGLYDSYRGVPVIGVYRWVEALEVALLIEMPQRAAFAPARRLAWAILGVGLATAVLLAVGIYLSARRIAGPVLAITRAAVEVSEGDLTSEAPVLTTDEVGVLARTFNRMTAQLRLLYGDLEQEIAERRRTEEEREELIRELEAKNAELERFTYTVSHDLKSPLVTIQGFLGLLEKDVDRGDAERIASDLARIRAASSKMTRLLEDLLELSRIGRLVNPPEAVPFGELVREALDLVAGAIAERGVEVRVAPDLSAVHGDRVRLVEVLQNLIENAVTAMADQPRPRLEIDAREEDGQLLCRVRDNGKGIEPRYHQKIFGLFERLDPDDRGTGIGLALVQRIVEVHGGRIRVESEPGQGATFLFTLPTPPTDGDP